MIRTRVFECEDGARFDSRADAKRHEAWLALRVLLRPGMNGALSCTEPSERDAEMARYLIEHGDEVRRLLRAKARDMTEGSG